MNATTCSARPWVHWPAVAGALMLAASLALATGNLAFAHSGGKGSTPHGGSSHKNQGGGSHYSSWNNSGHHTTKSHYAHPNSSQPFARYSSAKSKTGGPRPAPGKQLAPALPERAIKTGPNSTAQIPRRTTIQPVASQKTKLNALMMEEMNWKRNTPANGTVIPRGTTPAGQKKYKPTSGTRNNPTLNASQLSACAQIRKSAAPSQRPSHRNWWSYYTHSDGRAGQDTAPDVPQK